MVVNRQQFFKNPLIMAALLIVFLSLAFFASYHPLKMGAATAYFLCLVWVVQYSWRRLLPPHLALAAAILSVCCYFVVLGTVLFYSTGLQPITLWLMGYAATLSPLALLQSQHPQTERTARTPYDLGSLILIILSSLNSFAVIVTILARSTTSSSQTPWAHLPAAVFIFFSLAVLSALTAALRARITLPPILISLIFLAALGVATIIYPLGYGFDPAIHQATENILLETGTITPRPLFYIGHYALVATLATFTGGAVSLIDAYITLALAIIMLPLILYPIAEASVGAGARKLTPLIFLLTPYAYLIQSTPQSLSLLFSLISVILIDLKQKNVKISFSLIVASAVAALCIHPLSGLPILASVILYGILLYGGASKFRQRLLFTVFSAVVAFGVPLAMIAVGAFSPELTVRILPSLNQFDFSVFAATVAQITRFDDILYTAYALLMLFLAVAAAVGIRGTLRLSQQRTGLFLPYCAGLTGLSAAVIALFLTFNFATHEQNTYALRLITLSGIFLFPAIAAGTQTITDKLSNTGRPVFGLWACILASCAGIVWYMAYPRFDTRVQNKGYTSSRDDYNAVYWINAHAQNTSYVVLANQSVSATAIKEFGFARYTNGMLYYPLPTSGPLYQYFLAAMNPEIPIKDTVAVVQKKTGVSRVYVIINDYWSNAENLRVQFATYAKLTESLGRDAVFVFE